MAASNSTPDFAQIAEDLAKKVQEEQRRANDLKMIDEAGVRSKGEGREDINRQLLDEARARVEKGNQIRDAINEHGINGTIEKIADRMGKEWSGRPMEEVVPKDRMEQVVQNIADKFDSEAKGQRIQDAILKNEIGSAFAKEAQQYIKDGMSVGDKVFDIGKTTGSGDPLVKALKDQDNLDAMHRDPVYQQTIDAMKAKGFAFDDNPDSPNRRLAAGIYEASMRTGIGVDNLQIGNTIIGSDGKIDRNIFLIDGGKDALEPRRVAVSENAAQSVPEQDHANRASENRMKTQGEPASLQAVQSKQEAEQSLQSEPKGPRLV